jgi:hypothetical protein
MAAAFARSMALALAMTSLAAPVTAGLLIEGTLEGARDGRRYDLQVEVAMKPDGATGESRSLQSIRIPLVPVSEGRFEVSLSTGLEAYSLSGLSIEVLARPSESHHAFEPVVVSRVTSVP